MNPPSSRDELERHVTDALAYAADQILAAVDVYAAEQIRYAVTPRAGERHGEPRVLHCGVPNDAVDGHLWRPACGAPNERLVFTVNASDVTCQGCKTAMAGEPRTWMPEPDMTGYDERNTDGKHV